MTSALELKDTKAKHPSVGSLFELTANGFRWSLGGRSGLSDNVSILSHSHLRCHSTAGVDSRSVERGDLSVPHSVGSITAEQLANIRSVCQAAG